MSKSLAPSRQPAQGSTRATPLTPSRLLSTPLPDLLAELGVVSCPSSITDAGFFGALHELADGRLTLLLPGRDPVVEDTVARAMLGEVFGVPLAPLPDSVELSVLDSSAAAMGAC
ncbi:hypothetical protein OG897_13440 [Streptomyces sp. NBC_00237]|uniref:hypothetical protein n=1 Tax=Streptomyces sp. NBC_00237 TaxID=2975687 RepID=UPI002254F023|nr:hypothetical protein [Streptomyces sp. NBC_00237]MCX5202447.1 hypothetical protein [Streptomyces sp. NBC_00237]